MKKVSKLLTPLNILLFLIFLMSVFLRFKNLEGSLMFQGDQGRDALIVANIFKEKDLVFIGPVTSIGNMYLGPFYYYLMMPFLWLTYPSPMGPVYMVAILGVLTVMLMYFLGKKIFSAKTAFLASIFLALSHTAVSLSRFSWNPNPAPFFSLLMFYFTYLAWKKDGRYWLLVAAMFSILIQLHYVALLSAGGAGIIFLISLIEKIRAKTNLKKTVSNVLLSLLIFVLSLTPLVLFDIKHGGQNFQALTKIVTKEESFNLERKVGRRGVDALVKLFSVDLKNRGAQILFASSFGDIEANQYLIIVSFLFVLIYCFRRRFKLKDQEILLFAYLGTGLLGISLYQHEVYTHYFAYLLPMVYFFYGWLLSKIKPRLLTILATGTFLVFFIRQNYSLYQLKDTGWTIAQMKAVAQSIQDQVTEDEKYNIVLLSESKDLYGMNYRYFLSTMPNPPVAIEDYAQAEKLFIINEERKQDDVANLPIYEIVVFPEKNVLNKIDFNPGPEITVLGANKNPYNN